MNNLFWMFATFFFLPACGVHNGPLPTGDELDFKDQPARVQIVVATRGSYQYLLRLEGGAYGESSLCWPLDLPETHRTDGLSVRFDGTLTGDSLWVMRPGPTDIPEPDFQAPAVRIHRIEKN